MVVWAGISIYFPKGGKVMLLPPVDSNPLKPTLTLKLTLTVVDLMSGIFIGYDPMNNAH